jgi:hypothetical protein
VIKNPKITNSDKLFQKCVDERMTFKKERSKSLTRPLLEKEKGEREKRVERREKKEKREA